MNRPAQMRVTALGLAAAALFASGTLHSFEIDTGNADLVLRWDTTLRYNLGSRVEPQEAAILGNPNQDDGDRNFAKGKLVANRLDVLSEADLVWNKRFGARLSAAGWYDAAYRSLDGTSTATANTLVGGKPVAGALSPYASRFAKGASGEFLDAFVFANADVADMPLTLRAGRHTVYWGESLLGGGAIHGISYGQYSLDLWKALATPGIEIKELFRPRNSLSAQLVATPELTLAAQTFFDWEAARYPESGTFLTVNDGLLKGGDSLVVGPNQRMLQGAMGTPKKNGDWGLMARWSPEWLDGTAGLYLRRTADIQPQLSVAPAVAALPAATCGALGFTALAPTTCYVNPGAATVPQILSGQIGQYRAYYGRDIDILGLSLSRSIAGVSVGAELSYRRNMPLQSAPVTLLPAKIANPAAGQLASTAVTDDAPGARGNTVHGVLALIGSLPKTALFDSAIWQAEAVYNTWTKVTQNAAVFKGGAAYASNPANIDAASKNFVGLGINFVPTWYQVLPSVDLSLPLSWSAGIKGNSAVVSGGNKDSGSFSLGLAADIQGKYNLALRYVGFYGDYSQLANGAMNVPNGTPALLSDRGHVLLTFKTTF